MSKKKVGYAILCGTVLLTLGTGFAFPVNARPNNTPANILKANTPTPIHQEKTYKPTEQDIKNQYAIYEQYGLTYNANEDKLYYKDQVVWYFIDRYNNGQGVLCMWAYDLDGTIDLWNLVLALKLMIKC